MIAYLRGNLISKDEASVILETGGVGYEVNMAQTSVEALPSKGSLTRISSDATRHSEFTFIIRETGSSL